MLKSYFYNWFSNSRCSILLLAGVTWLHVTVAGHTPLLDPFPRHVAYHQRAIFRQIKFKSCSNVPDTLTSTACYKVQAEEGADLDIVKVAWLFVLFILIQNRGIKLGATLKVRKLKSDLKKRNRNYLLKFWEIVVI